MKIAVTRIDATDDHHYVIYLTVDGQAEEFRITVTDGKPRTVQAERHFWNRFWPTTPRLAANLLQLVLRIHKHEELDFPVKFHIQEERREPR